MPKPISKREFLAMIQQFTAVDAVGVSAVRGQRAGTKEAVEKCLAKIDLSRMPRRRREDFAGWLDHQTQCIQRKLPDPHQPWGVARKTLNLFLRSCFYNHYLRRAYALDKVGPWLEVPLDSVVARELREDAGKGILPRWKGLGQLKQQDSEKYQEHARAYAAACKLPVTVLLDNYLWLHGRLR